MDFEWRGICAELNTYSACLIAEAESAEAVEWAICKTVTLAVS